VARIDDTVFPNSDSVPAITVLPLRSTWETEDRVVRTTRLQRTREGGGVGWRLAVELGTPAMASRLRRALPSTLAKIGQSLAATDRLEG
jgi:hypothetical protein